MDNNFTEIGKNEGQSSSDDEDKDLRLYGAMQDTVADVPKVRPGLHDAIIVCFFFVCVQVWGISENRDKSYRSNARPHLTLAGLPSLVSYPTTASLF